MYVDSYYLVQMVPIINRESMRVYHFPTDSDVIKRKIESGQVKIKGIRKFNTTKKDGVKGNNGVVGDATIIAWLKAQDSAVTTTQLRDGLAFIDKKQVRQVMRRLAKTNAVTKTRAVVNKRSICMYQINHEETQQ